jgi:integrase
LTRSQFDETRRLAGIHPDQAKARRATAVPLNGPALAIVLKRRGMHATHVFSYQGKAIMQVSTKAWYGALERPGISDFRWHDLRHTWASGHVQGGTPLFARSLGAGNQSRWCERLVPGSPQTSCSARLVRIGVCLP